MAELTKERRAELLAKAEVAAVDRPDDGVFFALLRPSELISLLDAADELERVRDGLRGFLDPDLPGDAALLALVSRAAEVLR